MDSSITVEDLPMLGLCNLCLRVANVKSMFSEYAYNGICEIYGDMLLRSFSIDISNMDLGDAKRVICENCCSQLRNTLQFRDQVEAALQTLEATVKSVVKDENSTDACKDEPSDCNNTDDAVVKQENYESSLGDEHCDGDEDLSIAEYIKKENSVSPFLGDIENDRRKRRYTKPLYPDQYEIDKLLQNGLFPFRMTKNLFTCLICSERQMNLEDCKNHVLEHKSKHLKTAFKKMYVSNKSVFDIRNAKFVCKICRIEISDYDSLAQHIKICNVRVYKEEKLPFKLDKNQLDCPICQKIFLNYMSLNVHMNVHYPNHVCELCGKAFASKLRLRGHMRTHEIGEFPCKYCNLVFDKATKRENHVSKEHKSGIRYACKRCNISLSSFYARQKHLAEVHNEELKRYKCKACTQSYITPGHLSSHVRRDHLNERNHKCDKCDQAFYTSNALKMHMIKHDGERIHTCEVCNKSYQRLKTLKEHMRIHNNDKRFVCTVCGKAFTQKCTLKGHLRVHDRKIEEPLKLEVRLAKFL